jgi:hypothetical protein
MTIGVIMLGALQSVLFASRCPKSEVSESRDNGLHLALASLL